MPEEDFALASSIVENDAKGEVSKKKNPDKVRIPVIVFFLSALLNVLLVYLLVTKRKLPEYKEEVLVALGSVENSNTPQLGKVEKKSSVTDEWSPNLRELPSVSNTIIAQVDGEFFQGGASVAENTVLTVEQVFGIKHGGKEFGKLLVEAPIRFDGKSMRWSEDEIHNARNFLEKLKSYSDDLARLGEESTSLEQEWYQILRESRPVDSLRSDSVMFSK